MVKIPSLCARSPHGVSGFRSIHHSVRLGIAALFLLGGLLTTARAQFDFISETITSTVYDENFALDGLSGYGVDARVNITFTPIFVTSSSATYRLRVRLLDEMGNPVLLDTGFGTGTAVFSPQFVVNVPQFGTSRSYDTDGYLNPAVQLDPYSTYQVEITLQQFASPNWTDETTGTTPYAQIYHFTNTQFPDVGVNVIAEADSTAMIQNFRVQTDSGVDVFRYATNYTLTRFDDWFFIEGDPIPSNSITVFFDVELIESGTNNVIPLVQSRFSSNLNVPRFAETGLGQFGPASNSSLISFAVEPTVQTDSVNHVYTLEVTISHIEIPGPNFETVGNRSSRVDRLLDFNGSLFWGPIETRLTDVSDFNFKFFGGPSGGFLNTNLRIENANLVSKPGFTIGTGSNPGEFVNLDLDENGNAFARPGETIAVNQPNLPDYDSLNGIRFERTNPILTSTGGTADFMLILPAGMGYTFNSSDKRAFGTVDLGTFSLTALLNPTPSSITTNFGGSNVWITEETKPAAFETSDLTWELLAGELNFETTAARYVRAEELNRLETASVVNEAMRAKPSNERYYRSVNVSAGTSVLIEPGDNGDARMSTQVFFNPGQFITHYPFSGLPGSSAINPEVNPNQPGRVEFGGGGTALIVGDIVDTTQSRLEGINYYLLSYLQSCPDGDCGAKLTENMAIAPDDGAFFITPDGGLSAAGSLINFNGSSDTLEWGFIDVFNDFAHKVIGSYGRAAFAASGHFVTGSANTFSPVDGPGNILNTGVDDKDPSFLHRPYTTAYYQGNGDYPGFNLRPADNLGPFDAESFLAGEFTGPYALKPANGTFPGSKYYVRQGGLNGIHDPQDGAFPEDFEMYGYAFTLTNVGVSFLDSNVEESLIEGSVFVEYPSDFVQDFEELVFSCIGALESAKVPNDDPPKVLSYWNADFESLQILFERNPAVACDPGEGFLVIGVKAFASHVTVPLFGKLGFFGANEPGETAGNLIPKSFGLMGTDSRLKLPNTFQVAGPADERYEFATVGDAYYNNFDNTPAWPEPGFINFAGKLDVPFFEDMEVYIQTSAQKDNTTSPIFLTGGFEIAGQNAFEVAFFDDANNGFPTGISNTEYREGGGSGEFFPRARQSWLGVVNFDYPMQWFSSTRTFASAFEIEDEFLVLSMQHSVLYMSPQNVELAGGVSYEGLPSVNLANVVFNAIDEATGVLSSITNAASQQAADALAQGVDGFTQLLNSRMDKFYDQIFEQAIDPLIDQTVADLNTLYGGLNLGDSAVGVAHAAVVEPYIIGGANSFRSRLKQTLVTLDEAGSILDQIDLLLARAQTGIRAVVDEITVDSMGNIVLDPTGAPGESTLPGLLKTNMMGEYQIARALIYQLINQLAPEIAGNLVSLLSGPIEELDGQINELFANLAPGIETLKGGLIDLDMIIGDVRETITANVKPFTDELTQIVNDAVSEIDSITAATSSDFLGFLDTTFPTKAQFVEYTADEIKLILRNEIRDRFNGTNLIAAIQKAIKERIYDVQLTFQEGVNGCFQQLNLIMRDFLSEFIEEIDTGFDSFLDDVGGLIGGAQIDAYAHINGDSLKELLVNLYLQMQVPDELEFHGFIHFRELDSEGDEGCSYGSGKAAEVIVGATDIPVNWGVGEIRLTVEIKTTFNTSPQFRLRGLGGGIQMTDGTINFQAFEVTKFGAMMMFGLDENYIAAQVGVRFDSYEVLGGVYFGRACDLRPIELFDPDVAELLSPPITGIYVYGEGYFPIFGIGCLFNVSAGAGAGGGLLIEGPTIIGKMYAAVGGEALCILSIKGEITLIGVLEGSDFAFTGKGGLKAKLGFCPFCVKFGIGVKATYKNSNWDFKL